jgi:hypothetical protein
MKSLIRRSRTVFAVVRGFNITGTTILSAFRVAHSAA